MQYLKIARVTRRTGVSYTIRLTDRAKKFKMSDSGFGEFTHESQRYFTEFFVDSPTSQVLLGYIDEQNIPLGFLIELGKVAECIQNGGDPTTL